MIETRHSFTTYYAGGAWQAASSCPTTPVVNPYTEEVIGTVPSCSDEQVDVAVRAARRALPGWAATSVAERVAACTAIAEALAARAPELALNMTREMGAPHGFSVTVQVALGLIDLASMADFADDVEWSRQRGNTTLARLPVGVVGAITPWNYPLHQITAKISAALVAGCPVVVKPSELTPGAAYLLAEAIDEVGLPPGVFNLVPGVGPVVGEAIAGHPLVDMVSFTGSTRAGRRVAELAAQGPRRAAMELGGKSATVVLPDVDEGTFATAVSAGLAGALTNSGQTCSALTRLLVPRNRLAEAAEVLSTAIASFPVGDPVDPATQQGPLVSAAQRDRVRAYIEEAVDQGAEVVVGGSHQPDTTEHGYFVLPTVVRAEAGSRIEQEEVFGPVLTLVGYEPDAHDQEAQRIACGTPYGLAGAVWAADEERARRFALGMRAGQVSVNGGTYNPTAPFGGFGVSGYGRELGSDGIEEFTAVSALSS